MNDRHYLLKVLGLSAIPRVVTSVLTMVSFPLMVRTLGASQYGVVVYLAAVTVVLESFADFGVSSAAGKEIAAARETGRRPLDRVIRHWARLQLIVAVLGFVPLLGVTYLVATTTSQIAFSTEVLVILVTATWVTIPVNFIRSAFASTLAFRSLTALDSFESIVRSLSWLFVAYIAPTTLGLAVANLLTVGSAAVLGSFLLWRVVHRLEAPRPDEELDHVPTAIDRQMIRESMNFLWLRLATRVFQSIPVMLFGRLFGSEVVGIVGAFNKISETLAFPFTVVGSALAVRATGIVANGAAAARRLWDVVARFIAVAVLFSVSAYLGSALLAKILLPKNDATAAFGILAITITTTAVSSIVAPMSDYVGALRSRNLLLTMFSLGQIPVIYLGGRLFGSLGGIGAYVLMLALMNIGYVKIALVAFFPRSSYVLPSEMMYFVRVTLVAASLTVIANHVVGLTHWTPDPLRTTVFDCALFWVIVLCFLLAHRGAKRFFFDRGFLEFQVRGA